MDLQSVVDANVAMTCAVSVEYKDGRRGKFRIVCGNKPYIDSIENPAPGAEMLTDKFIPNSEYTRYLSRDLNFEDACYRAAVEKKCVHSYAHPDRLPLWFNMSFIPINSDQEDLYYCLYIMEINFKADSEQMSDISGDMASAVLKTCIKLRGTEDFKATMKEVIKDINDICEAQHCCILTIDEYTHDCAVLCESIPEGSPMLPMEHYVDKAFYDIAASWEGTIAGSNCLVAKDEQDMEVVKERNPVWYESLKGAGAHNIVLFPLRSNGNLLGYMWAINYNAEKALEIKETLELTTFILGSELGNYLLVDRLQFLSSRDMLTGVMNRNEMNNFVDALCKDDSDNRGPVAVIFADLNGLKTVNDRDGHTAGDILLKNAASALREVFDETDIYRAGGDEFSVIITDMTEESVAEKIEAIRKASEKYDRLSFAIGGCSIADSRNVRLALMRADQLMYKDKQEYYAAHPEERR